jgi:DNA polymerase-4
VGRTFIHADLDAFYASVEQLDNPDLRGKPVVVGGPPESRGVVTTASYEARKFGVRSAMPMSRALRMCPHAIRVSPRFERYGEISRQVMDVFHSITPLVEPMSMDEAYLDVTGQHAPYGGARGLGEHLKRQVKDKTGLTLSVGIATSKSVAKVASDAGKPDGLMVVFPGQEAAFLAPMSTRVLWGVGPKFEKVLAENGFRTVGDIQRAPPNQLEALFGGRGHELWDFAHGRDNREIVTEWERKSVSAETTFPRDLPDGPALRDELANIAAGVAERLRRSGSRSRTIAIKLRYTNFRTITRQMSRPEPTDDPDDILAAATALLEKTVAEGDTFRLLGIHCSKLSDAEPAGETLPLFSEATPEAPPDLSS